jgi:hypothetical protein
MMLGWKNIALTFKVIAFMVIVLGATSSMSLAAGRLDSAQTIIDTRFENQDSVVNQMFDIRAALLHYHNSYTAWPAIFSEISTGNITTGTQRVYAGRYDTPFGSSITGAASTDQRFYVLTVDVGRANVAEYIARRINGKSTGTTVTMALGTPTASVIVPNALLRINDPSDPTNDRNTMRTDLIMAGHSIFDLNEVETGIVNAGTVNVGTVNIATLLKVDGAADFTGLANFSGGMTSTTVGTGELTVSGAAAFSGPSTFNQTVNFNQAADFGAHVTFKDDVIFERNLSAVNVLADDGQFATITATANTALTANVQIGGTLNAQHINGTSQTLTGRQVVDSQTINHNQAILGSQTIAGDSTIAGNSLVGGTQTVRDLIVTNATTVAGITNLGQMTVAGDTTLYQYLWFEEGQKTGITKGPNDAVRLKTKSAFLDIGNYSAGWINVDSSLGGLAFADPIKAPKVSVLGSGDSEVEIRSVDGGSPMLVFANDAAVDDMTFKLTGNDELSLIGGQLNLTAGLAVTGSINANGGVVVDGKPVISADGNTLYENSEPLGSKYLGINATAKNADLIGGLAASQLARRDIDPSFQNQVTVAGRIYAHNGLHINNEWLRIDGQSGLYFQTYGGGWHMTDTTWVRSSANKSIFTGGLVRAEGGFQVDGKWVISSDGNTLYENSVALGSKYLGIGAKSVDSDRIDGIDGWQLARIDTDNIFSRSNTFNGDLNYKGTELDARFYNVGEKVSDADLFDGINSDQFARLTINNSFSATNTFGGISNFHETLNYKRH